jgi:hypothetical protein
LCISRKIENKKKSERQNDFNFPGGSKLKHIKFSLLKRILD